MIYTYLFWVFLSISLPVHCASGWPNSESVEKDFLILKVYLIFASKQQKQQQGSTESQNHLSETEAVCA